MNIDQNTAAAAALGGSILASGQGGWRDYGEKVASLAVQLGSLRFVDFDYFEDDDILLEVSIVGSPATQRRHILPIYQIQAVEKLIAYSGLPVKGLISTSSGGMLTVCSWLPGAALSLPVVDAVSNERSHPDGGGPMSHNLPEDYLSRYMAIGGNSAEGTYVEAYFSGQLPTNAEIVRQLAVRAGGTICVARNPVTAGYAKKYAAFGHISHAVNLGQAVLDNPGTEARIRVVCAYTGGSVIAKGKVSRFNFNTKGVYDSGIALVESGSERCTIHFQNQYMELYKNDEMAASFPDLIVVLSLADGLPVASYQLDTEQEVAVIAVPYEKYAHLGKTHERMNHSANFAHDISYGG